MNWFQSLTLHMAPSTLGGSLTQNQKALSSASCVPPNKKKKSNQLGILLRNCSFIRYLFSLSFLVVDIKHTLKLWSILISLCVGFFLVLLLLLGKGMGGGLDSAQELHLALLLGISPGGLRWPYRIMWIKPWLAACTPSLLYYFSIP